MKIAILGSGGREHAIANQITKSTIVEKLYCIPGNAGTKSIAENIILDIYNFESGFSTDYYNRLNIDTGDGWDIVNVNSDSLDGWASLVLNEGNDILNFNAKLNNLYISSLSFSNISFIIFFNKSFILYFIISCLSKYVINIKYPILLSFLLFSLHKLSYILSDDSTLSSNINV